MNLKHIFAPIKIGNVKIKNRFFVSPMVTNYCTNDGKATETFIAYHEARAKGGWGLIITEDYAVDPAGRAFPYIPGLWEDSQIESHAELTRRVHAHGAKIFAQIYHAGRQTQKRVIGTDPVAPTAINCPVMLDMPHELTTQEAEKIVSQFGDCALRAKKAGFDGVQIHGGHGYLVSEFMSSYSNKRFDKFGGNLVRRMRFPLDIVADIRKKCGKDFAIDFKISGDEIAPGGRNIEDTKTIARMLEDAGVNSFNISVGVYASWYTQVPPAVMGHGWLTDYADEVKKAVSVPVSTVGRVNDPIIADSIIASGKADVAIMGRASIADPELPNKAMEGRFEDIIQCMACLVGCTGMIDEHLPARCVLNPLTGRENEFAITPANEKKKVYIAGGGPAGMEAAIVAAQRGHDVTLFEKSGRLGGQYYLASIPPWKGEISAFLAWQVHTMEKLSIKVKMNTELTADIVRQQKPDTVIIATGSVPILPKIPGIEHDFVKAAGDVLEGKAVVGENVAVIGGGMIGCETANHLAHHGKKPTIIEMLPEVATEEPNNMKRFLMISFKENDVDIHVNATVEKIYEDGTIDVLEDGQIKKLGKFDNVVIAAGMRSVNSLAEELNGFDGNVKVVGDAKTVRKVLEANEEGYEAALKI
ncbi:MAG: FAD-dependent oxidoreductase [Christensenellales bacterium]